MYTSTTGLRYEISPYVHGQTPIDVCELQAESTQASMLPLTDDKLIDAPFLAVAHIGEKAIGINGIIYIWDEVYAEKGGLCVLRAYRRQGIATEVGHFVTQQIFALGYKPITLCNEQSAGVNLKDGWTHVSHAELPQSMFEECKGCPTEKPIGKICCHEAFVKLG